MRIRSLLRKDQKADKQGKEKVSEFARHVPLSPRIGGITTLSIEEIAEQCGFHSGALLRHHFRAQVKISPRAYRNQFRQTPEV